MRQVWKLIAVAVVGVDLGLAVMGCGSSASSDKEKMSSKMNDKMDGNMNNKMNKK